MRRHVVGEPDVASNDGVVAYAHTAEDGGVGIDGYVVLDYGVARLVDGVSLQVVVEIARAEGDADVVDYTYYGVPMGSVVVVFHGKERADFHSVDVRHILVADEAEATDLLAQYLAGEQTEDAFAALATAHSTDTGSAANGGLYEDVYIGQMVKPFENWCFDASRKAGDTGIVATDYGYHVMYYVGSSEYPFWQHQAASTLASDWEASLSENMETTLLDGMKYVDP